MYSECFTKMSEIPDFVDMQNSTSLKWNCLCIPAVVTAGLLLQIGISSFARRKIFILRVRS